jgi:hypothetical protein
MKSEILRRHADGRVTIRSTAGDRSKTTTVRLRSIPPRLHFYEAAPTHSRGDARRH